MSTLMYDAGTDAATRYPHITIRRARIAGHHAVCLPRRALILVNRALTRGGWNAAVAHELVHLDRGDTAPVDRVLDARQELLVEKEAARRLIDIHHLADVAAAFPDDPHRVADELDVDYDTLAVRMRHLHPSERHYLRRRLAAVTGEEIA